MNEGSVIERVLALCPGAQHVITDGDSYFFCGEDRLMPFATLVTRDVHDAEPVSDLARDGVYRLNLGITRASYRARFGELPRQPETWRTVETGHDYATLDALLPHPSYSPLAWVCVLNPSEQTFASLEPLVTEAYAKAAPSAAARVASKSTPDDG